MPQPVVGWAIFIVVAMLIGCWALWKNYRSFEEVRRQNEAIRKALTQRRQAEDEPLVS